MSGWIYRGVWAQVTECFRVPRTPPALPTREGEQVETFRPAPGFLSYLKLKFWLVLLLIDAAILALWVLLMVVAPLAGAALTLPLFLLAIVPDIVAYIAIQLRFDTTWYVVGERSLRIRRGIITVTETTITFENVQNVKIAQGPLQRHYGIADLVVETAGGGSESEDDAGESAHVGRIEGVAEARRLRDLILNRVRDEASAARRRIEHRWPDRYLSTLREIRDTVAGRRLSDTPAPLRIGSSPDGGRSGIAGTLGRLFRLPAEPLTLPSWAGADPARFRPARSYLGYELLRTFLASLVGGFLVVSVALGVAVQKELMVWSWSRVALILTGWALVLAVIVGVALFTAWLQYHVTWYAVGDRGLRLRRGVWVVREATISFDNVQNVNVQQGPLERMFGIWSVHIHTAGASGAGSGSAGGGGLKPLLGALMTILSAFVPGLAGVGAAGGGSKKKSRSNASAIVGVPEPQPLRDHVMTRVRASRAAGLGDEIEAGAGRLRASPEQLEMLGQVRDEIRRLVRAS